MPASDLFHSFRLNLRSQRLRLLLLSALCLGTFPATLLADPADRSADGLQQMVDHLRDRLGIPHAVAIAIVDANPKLVSVARADAAERPFRLAIEAAFMDTLSDDELAAALAHELGHVWVFTHHPFLQTERLANDVALRAVSRESLERLYDKMWARLGTGGDFGALLGPTPAAAALAVAEAAPEVNVRRADHTVD